MDIKRWIVTAVDFDADGQCDGKARILATCSSAEEAKNFIRKDMHEYVDESELGSEMMSLDETKMRVATEDLQTGCEWNFEEVEIHLNPSEMISASWRVNR